MALLAFCPRIETRCGVRCHGAFRAHVSLLSSSFFGDLRTIDMTTASAVPPIDEQMKRANTLLKRDVWVPVEFQRGPRGGFWKKAYRRTKLTRSRS